MDDRRTPVPETLFTALADRYRMERELGAGGMATVYLAMDLRHHRRVAIKVLHPDLAAVIGSARFLAEIRTIANLQHPHILGLIDSGEVGGIPYYVMPFVDGESLRDRLQRERQLPVPEAVRLSCEVASALDYAHRRGVIHRDIKPENVLLQDGSALVADFGIALAVSAGEVQRLTQTGLSLGTPAYMSPEQAMGERTLDGRTDVYSLGVMTYEMLAGEPPFGGPNAQAIVSRVLTEHPRPLAHRRGSVPDDVAEAVEAALQKLPADRPPSAAAYAAALQAADAQQRSSHRKRSATSSLAPTRRWQLATAVLGLALITATAAWGWRNGASRERSAPPVVRFILEPGVGIQTADAPGTAIALSPDGSHLLLTAREGTGPPALYLRSLAHTTPARIPGTEEARHPIFSPDGQSIGFWANNRLRRVALRGGAGATIGTMTYPTGATWGADDVITVSLNDSLYQVDASGGELRLVAGPASGSGESFRFPEVTPDGRAVLFTIVDRAGNPSLAAMTLPAHRIERLGVEGMSARLLDNGQLTWVQMDGTLMTAPFDTRRRRLGGAARPVAEGIRVGPGRLGKLTVARNGTFAFLTNVNAAHELVIVDSDGRETVLALPAADYRRPRVSPDGRRLALQVEHGQAWTSVWVADLASGAVSRLTPDSGSFAPEWTPDGRSIFHLAQAIRSDPIAVRRPHDGSTAVDTFTFPQAVGGHALLAPDGRRVIFHTVSGSAQGDIWMGPLDDLSSARPLLATQFNEVATAVHPGGTLLAYFSNETGRNEVYVRRLEEGSPRWRISPRGGHSPRWSADGRQLYYRNEDSIFVTGMRMTPDPQPGPVRGVAHVPVIRGTAAFFDVFPDGRLIVTRYRGEERLHDILVVLNWFEQRTSRSGGSR